MDDPFRIRPATLDDLDRLAALERECFTDSWSREALSDTLRSATARGWVGETAAGVMGYAVVAVVGGGAEILTLGVARACRRQGLARRLLESVRAEVAREGVEEVWLEVRVSNTAARTLYESLGYRVAGMRRAYYRLPTEDALVLRLGLSGSA